MGKILFFNDSNHSKNQRETVQSKQYKESKHLRLNCEVIPSNLTGDTPQETCYCAAKVDVQNKGTGNAFMQVILKEN